MAPDIVRLGFDPGFGRTAPPAHGRVENRDGAVRVEWHPNLIVGRGREPRGWESVR